MPVTIPDSRTLRVNISAEGAAVVTGGKRARLSPGARFFVSDYFFGREACTLWSVAKSRSRFIKILKG